MRIRTTNFATYFKPLLAVTILLVVWAILSETGAINPIFLPRLPAVGAALVKTLASSEIYRAAGATMFRALVGLALSVIVAVPAGLVFGRVPKLYQFFEFPVDFFRSVPSSALFFLFMLVFGIGDASKVAVVFYGCSLVMLMNTIYGARPTRERADRINMLRSFRANSWQIFRFAVLPDALPSIAAGVRVCTSMALVLVIVTEMFLGATVGLGRQIYDHYLTYHIPEMYVVIIILGFLGYAANKGVVLLERKLTFWLPEQK